MRLQRYRSLSLFKLLAPWILVASCTPGEPIPDLSLKKSVDELKSEQTRRRQELSEIHQQIDHAEAELLASRAAAERSQCQARRAQIDAEVKQRVARCHKARAEESRCSARNERKRSSGTLGGMALGGLAALATGGAALPWVIGGGLAGNVSSGNGRCSAAKCQADETTVRRTVLRQQGLRAMPMCGPEDTREVLSIPASSKAGRAAKSRSNDRKRGSVAVRKAKQSRKAVLARYQRELRLHERERLRKFRAYARKQKRLAIAKTKQEDGC